MKKYRFDDSYEKVYEYDAEQDAYVFIGTYYNFNITKNDSYSEAVEKVENYFMHIF